MWVLEGDDLDIGADCELFQVNLSMVTASPWSGIDKWKSLEPRTLKRWRANLDTMLF